MKNLAAALAGLSFLIGGQAFAADYQTEPMAFTQGQFYGQLGLGYGMINDVDISSTGVIGGVTFTGNGAYEFSGGFAITGILGYQFNDFLAVEGQLAYNQSEYDQLTGTINLTGPAALAVAGSVDIDGDISLLTGFGNVIVSPFQMDMINPYVGVGIGFARIEDEVNSIAGNTAFAYTADRTKLAATAIAGVDFALSENLSAGGRYQFIWADTGTDFTDDATGHSFFLTGKLHF